MQMGGAEIQWVPGARDGSSYYICMPANKFLLNCGVFRLQKTINSDQKTEQLGTVLKTLLLQCNAKKEVEEVYILVKTLPIVWWPGAC